MKKLFLIIYSIPLFFSCKVILTKKYAFNKSFHFQNRSSYKSFIESKFTLTPASYLYVDSSEAALFMVDIVRRKTSFFYGLFHNDSTEITFTAQTNKNCIGQVNKAIHFYNSGIDSFTTSTNNVFKNGLFRKLEDDAVFVYPKTKASAFFVYGYSMGNYFDNYFNELNNTLSKDSCNFFIILLDPVQRLKK